MTNARPFRLLALGLLLAPMVSHGSALQELAAEAEIRARYEQSLLTVSGVILGEDGLPVDGATLSLGEGQVLATADSSGQFALNGLVRRNAALRITAPGFREEILPLHLRRHESVTEITLDPILMASDDAGSVRFLFGGDTSFGRRYVGWDPYPTNLPPRYVMPPDHPDAFIQTSDPLPGALQVVSYLKPYFEASDYPVLNLESVVTTDLTTPHLGKEYVYFTLPGTLPALTSLGIEYVSLGNNHQYDYLDHGVQNTLAHLAAAGLNHSGLGTNDVSAAAPFRPSPARLGNHPYSLLSFSSIRGDQTPPEYNATATSGGAAPLTDTALVTATISNEVAAGFSPIVQLHTGKEYTLEPLPYARGRMELAAENGAVLVISHHPHTARGFGFHQGVLIAHGLGNLFFDQTRLETQHGLMARIDLQGGQLVRARALPLYNEDLRPRMLAGRSADLFLRRVGEFSDPGTLVFPYHHQAWIAANPADVLAYDHTVHASVTVPASGWTVVDLRGLAPDAASLARLVADLPAIIRPGRDLMIGGDFEDHDVDEQSLEISRWSYSASCEPVLHEVYRGATAVCSIRDAYTSTVDSILAYGNRIRVEGNSLDEPNKDLTVFGYHRGINAGPLALISRYYASIEEEEFGEEVAVSHPGGTYGWAPFASDLNMPPDSSLPDVDHKRQSPRALRLFFRHSPPPSGGLARRYYDDVSVISWGEPLPASLPVDLPTPHAREFLRIEAAPQTTLELDLTFRQYRPRLAARSGGLRIAIE